MVIAWYPSCPAQALCLIITPLSKIVEIQCLQTLDIALYRHNAFECLGSEDHEAEIEFIDQSFATDVVLQIRARPKAWKGNSLQMLPEPSYR